MRDRRPRFGDSWVDILIGFAFAVMILLTAGTCSRAW